MPSIFCHMQKGVFLVVTIAVQLWQKANGSRMVFKAIHENRLKILLVVQNFNIALKKDV